MKKIAFVAHGLGIGGAQRVAALLASKFAEDGYEVCYVITRSEEKIYELNEEIRIVQKVPHKGLFQPVVKNWITYKAIHDYHPDVVISFLTNEMIMSSALIGCPQIYTLRNDPNHDMVSFFRRHVRNALYKKADAVVFQTKGAKEYFSNDIQEKGFIIENPITKNLPYWKKNTHRKCIITACRLEKQKNVALLIRAFHEFLKHHSGYELDICGKGSLLEELMFLCKKLEISDRVHFLGFRTDIHRLISEAEMFVISSDYEGISNSMLEALAIGIPTISTDSPPGGAAQYIQNGVNGFLTPVGDVHALCDAMDRIAEHRDFQLKLSDHAITIRDKLSVDKIYAQWKRIIDRIVKEQRVNIGDYE